ncbi:MULTISPECIES: MerR family transcriptional regulator [Sphingomonas]|uniref:DNA-binding transcriptional MerR regulator n=1 Tax=Sphingomonas leidyi TaxID=68569 RepID=A0A7X5ZW47_9SPHN|nr:MULTISPECIES: MerR family transcriptional regulator [Sphingomonas]MBN8810089.1 MerR family transcriptional regulator [Sphingomonas sp.]MDF2384502.1 MerR family transcriptional regulator [Nostoc ellipsosporum NOK]NIJ65741.1 DNA-binding transcriptional MerR regulator [Sphingomonas leidyi]OJY50674.1 MAG: MerR family transcriptional regulator [Sphingomonas sp. 67-41]
MPGAEKAAGALRTIGELAQEIGRPQHILRYWETRFPQLRPLTRAGNRRYYRAEDVALVRRIHDLLSNHGYTIRGVQKLLAAEKGSRAARAAAGTSPGVGGGDKQGLKTVRDSLARALDEDS